MTSASPVQSITFNQDNLSEACLDDIQLYFWTRIIELLTGQTSPTNPEIYQGIGTLLNVSCQIEVLSKADQSLFILCAKPQEDAWNFGTCFPLMPGAPEIDVSSIVVEESEASDDTEDEDSEESFLLRFITLQDSIWFYIYTATSLNSFALQKELNKLSLWSQWLAQNPSTFPINSGFYLRGTLPDTLPDVLQELAGFLDINLSTLHLQSSVTFPDDFPVLTLEIPLSSGQQFGPATLQNAVIALSSPLYFSPHNSQISLFGNLNLSDIGEIDVSIDFPLASDIITAKGNYTKNGLPFVDAADLSDLPSLQPEGGGALGLELQFSKSQKTIEKASFAIDLDNWSLIDNLLMLQELSFSFTVFEPLDSKMVVASITTQAVLGNKSAVSLRCSGYYPANQFYFGLDSEIPLKIADLVADLGAEADGLPDLQIDDLSVEYNLTIKEFETRVGVIGSWEIIDNVQLTELRFEIFGQVTYSCEIAAQFLIGNVALYLDAAYSNQAWQFKGGTNPGEVIPIGDLITDLISMFGAIELPEVLQSLEITNLQVSFNTATKDFSFIAETVFVIDDQGAALSLNIDIVNSTAGFQKTFSGLLTLGPRQFSVLFDSTPSTSLLQASFSNPEGEQIHLINDILGLISQNPDLQINGEFNLLEFTLYFLELSFEKDKSNNQKTYGIKGDFGWNPNLSIGGSEPLQLRAEIDLAKPSGGKLSGAVSGSIQTPIPNMEFLQMEGFYQFSQTSSALGLRLQLGDVSLEAAYSSTESLLTFSVTTATPLTFSKVMNFFAGLVDPSIDAFAFDPPWDTFTEIEIPIDALAFSFNTATKEMSMRYTPTSAITIPGLPGSLLEIQELSLDYGIQTISGRSKPVKKLKLTLEATFLGSNQSLGWDPINEAPPEVPGQGASVFELRYLGLGQHIAFTQAGQVTSIKEVMDLLRGSITDRETELQADRSLALRNPLETFGDGGAISFSPESEWLIGLDASLLKTLDLTIIFNDPVIYGLRIELYGELAKNFAGLQFEILYQRITDTIGKYHVDLTLPDAVRYLQIGAVSVTMPLIVVDIFTNGDFKPGFLTRESKKGATNCENTVIMGHLAA